MSRTFLLSLACAASACSPTKTAVGGMQRALRQGDQPICVG